MKKSLHNNLIFIIIVCIMLIFSSCEKRQDEVEPNTDKVAPKDAIVATDKVMSKNPILPETADMGQSYIDDIVFFGDSTTYGLKAYGMLKDKKETTQVWTPKNGTLTLYRVFIDKIVYSETGEEIAVLDALALKKPKMLVVTLGVNGVSTMKIDYFGSTYAKIIEAFKVTSPDTIIIAQSIFPVSTNYKNLDQINNQKINEANDRIVKVCEEVGINYLNTSSVLKEADGNLISSYQNGDGMHLNAVGFTQVLTFIRTHGYVKQ